MTSQVILPELVELDVAPGDTPESVIRHLASLVTAAGRAADADELAADALAREAKSGTGVPGGVAIPHCRSESVTEPTLAFARLSRPVDFSGPDGPADLVFLIAAPAGGGKAHLKILSAGPRPGEEGFRAALRGAATAEEIVDVVDARIAGTAQKTARSPLPPPSVPPRRRVHRNKAVTRIVAVTACRPASPTLHGRRLVTQVADERDDVELVVETQGPPRSSPCPRRPSPPPTRHLRHRRRRQDRGRFAGKPVVESGVSAPSTNPP